MTKESKILWSIIGLALSAGATADPVTINYTVDNAVLAVGVCSESDCEPLDLDLLLADGSEPNAADWTTADSITVDLAPGTYGIVFVGENLPNPDSGNPAGFLAEILWQGMSNLSSSAWDVTVDGVNWVSATEWAQNGTGIWGGNLLGEISSDAYWLWSENNFDGSTDSVAGFRTTITVVSEPGTLALFGIGLLGIGIAGRRRRKV